MNTLLKGVMMPARVSMEVEVDQDKETRQSDRKRADKHFRVLRQKKVNACALEGT